MNFEVSVIIPVYNAEDYIAKAVRSAMLQPEVKEIIIVNDGSTDDTLKILKGLKNEDSRIILLEHEFKKNKGRSASRNLGIRRARCHFLAFLDADDYYLTNRFESDKKVFKENSDADGVYNAIGAEFYSNAQRREKERLEITTLNGQIKPENLFFEMWPKGYSGSFSIDGLTVKRKIFEKSGYFNEKLKVAEDTELFIKMSLSAKLYPGEIKKPVSIRGVHENNVTHLVGKDIYIENYYEMYRGLLIWGSEKKISFTVLDYFWERLSQHYHLINSNSEFSDELLFWLKTGFKSPELFQLKRFLKAFPIYRRIIKS